MAKKDGQSGGGVLFNYISKVSNYATAPLPLGLGGGVPITIVGEGLQSDDGKVRHPFAPLGALFESTAQYCPSPPPAHPPHPPRVRLPGGHAPL